MARKVSKIPKGKIKSLLTSQREKLSDQQRSAIQQEETSETLDRLEVPTKKLSRVQMLEEAILQGIDNPNELMVIIREVFNDTEKFPRPGNIYTFVYTAKTPGIAYDKHPLVIVEAKGYSTSGFRGYNIHWSDHRNYVWEGVGSLFHRIQRGEEFDYLHDVPYKDILYT
jgi:hypothetical protein